MYHILVVDDDAVDRANVLRAFRKINLANPVSTVKDGVEAQEFLCERLTKPLMILLDLRMPRMDGHEFLHWLRCHENTFVRAIPVVVLTTSSENIDIVKSYENLISGYIVKPVEPTEFLHVIKALGNYWMLSKAPYIDEPKRSHEQTENTTC